MKTINKNTKCLLEDGEAVLVDTGTDKIPCVVRRCGKFRGRHILCYSCILWNDDWRNINGCSRWSIAVELDGNIWWAAFIPLEDAVE